MNYLLDVSALIALGYGRNVFHKRTFALVQGKCLLTCSISELGFVRVLSSFPEADVPVPICRKLLFTMKSEWKITQISDFRSAADLPAWVTRPEQTTDGHLVELAGSVRARLATLDEGIPGAFVIPQRG